MGTVADPTGFLTGIPLVEGDLVCSPVTIRESTNAELRLSTHQHLYQELLLSSLGARTPIVVAPY
jgi:hypothetical protein